MRIPIVSDVLDKVAGNPPTDLETPAIPPALDFNNVNQNNFSEAYYRFLENVAKIESKPDMLQAIESSNLSRQAKDGLIMFVRNELDINMMYSDLSEGQDKDISYLKTKINLIVSTIAPAYKSDRKNPFFVYLTENVLSQAWHTTTRATGKDRERTISGKTHMKYEGTQTLQKSNDKK
jgi:hypothetical protein